jgi:RecB family exonuclease
LTGLQASLRKIAGAETAEDLRQELLRFSSVYIDEKRWPEDEKKVFQYALDLLAGIDTALSGIPMPTPLTPFKLFLYQVDKTIYVPKTSHKGIPVYPYRVAAGTAPLYHFVLGISQEKCSVPVDPCRFLRKDEKKKLGIEENDMGSAFLEAYAVSGQRVFFSSGSETFGGKILVPEVFLEHFQGASSGEPETAPPGLFGSERALWYGKQEEEGTADAAAGDRVSLTRLFPVQKSGFLRAEHTCLVIKQFDAAGSPVSDSSLIESIRSHLEKDGTLRMSPTSLEEFARCPFSFLFSRVLRIEEQEYDTRYADPLFLGSFAHEVAKRVYRRIGMSDGVFNAENIRTYLEFAESAIQQARRDEEKRGYVFIPPVWEDITRRTEKWIGELFELEQGEFDGLAVLETERRLEAEPEKASFALYGQIDRLSGSRDEAVLIDYKKKSRVRKVDISGSATDPPVSFQIPIYIFLAEAEGYAVGRAGYVSFEEGKYVPVLESAEGGKGWFSREEIEGLIDGAVRRACEAVEKIARGNFPAAGPGCDPCRFRGVCRVKYIAG